VLSKDTAVSCQAQLTGPLVNVRKSGTNVFESTPIPLCPERWPPRGAHSLNEGDVVNSNWWVANTGGEDEWGGPSWRYLGSISPFLVFRSTRASIVGIVKTFVSVILVQDQSVLSLALYHSKIIDNLLSFCHREWLLPLFPVRHVFESHF
jgi:hypothetical protein